MKRNLQCAILFILGTAVLAAAPARGTAASGIPDNIAGLLRDAKTEAFRISADALTLKSWTREQRRTPAGHAAEIERMTKTIDEAVDTASKLAAARAGATQWQATLVDEVVPLLSEIVSSTSDAIRVLNNCGATPLAANGYRGYMDANADIAHQLSGTVAKLVDYGNTRSRLEALRSSVLR